MKILIINGPNLNLLGKREPEIYGHQSFESYLEELKNEFPFVELEYYQSNHEGGIIDCLHHTNAKGIVINSGGFSHTSVAIADAIAAIKVPVIEVHISNVHSREDFRQRFITGAKCEGVISGLGLDVYRLAIVRFIYVNRS